MKALIGTVLAFGLLPFILGALCICGGQGQYTEYRADQF